MFRWFILALAFCTAASADCLPQSSISSVMPSGWRVYQPTTCPNSDSQTTYKYFPQTACTTIQMASALTSTWDEGSIIQTIWANRWSGGHNQKPNPPNGIRILVNDGVHGSFPCFLSYSSQDLSVAANESEVAYAIGRYITHNGRGWLDYTRAVGLPDSSVYEWANFVAAAPTLCSTWDAADSVYIAADIVVEPQAKLSDVPTIPKVGIKIDWEVQSGMTTTETNAEVYEIGQNVHGRGYLLVFYTNPLDGTSAPYNGIDGTNVDYLLAHVDNFGILVWPANPQHKTVAQSLTDQMAMFTSPDYSKFNLIADMAMDSTDAGTLRVLTTTTYPFGGIDVWIDGQTVCTSAYNQALQTLLGIP